MRGLGSHRLPSSVILVQSVKSRCPLRHSACFHRRRTSALKELKARVLVGTAYASDPENTFEVPVGEVLQSGMPSLEVTVQLIDGSAATVSLTPARLGAKNGDYPLP